MLPGESVGLIETLWQLIVAQFQLRIYYCTTTMTQVTLALKHHWVRSRSVSVSSSVALLAAVLLDLPGDSGIICTVSSSSCIAIVAVVVMYSCCNCIISGLYGRV